jgi:hypothetical protein
MKQAIRDTLSWIATVSVVMIGTFAMLLFMAAIGLFGCR